MPGQLVILSGALSAERHLKRSSPSLSMIFNLKNLLDLAKRASKRDVREIIPYYPAKTVKRLMECGLGSLLA